jgi:hypothetical protein
LQCRKTVVVSINQQLTLATWNIHKPHRTEKKEYNFKSRESEDKSAFCFTDSNSIFSDNFCKNRKNHKYEEEQVLA